MSADIVEHGDEIISVGQLNQQAKKLLENQFKGISVLGEISNIARPSSGHIYFTLKDEDGAIRCAMFKNQNLRLNFEPQNGDQCVLKGQVSLYAPRGDYQLIVSSMQPAGAGKKDYLIKPSNKTSQNSLNILVLLPQNQLQRFRTF